MGERDGIKWSREETILAFDLYCRTAFAKISRINKDIIELAGLLGRTPSAVGLKMHNLAHYDPELQARNIRAMAHGSKLDEQIWEEFCNDWEGLSYQAQCILAEKRKQDLVLSIDMTMTDFFPQGEYREQMLKTRVGQYFFRMSVLNAYHNKCCITGLKNKELLIASHIKPWKDSDEKTERTNPRNGLCLNTLHDKAFDKGLITLDYKYKVIISNKIKEYDMDSNTYRWFMSYEWKQIMLPEKFLPRKEFLEYHNDVVFNK